MRYILLFILFIIGACTNQKKTFSSLNSVNVQDKVGETEKKNVVNTINLKYMLTDTSNAQVYVKLELSQNNIKNVEDFDKIFNLQWSILPESGLREKLKSGKIEIDKESVKVADDHIQIKFPISKPKGLQEGILAFECIDTPHATKYTHDTNLDFTGSKINATCMFFESENADFPYFKNFVLTGSKLYVKSYFWQNKSLKLLHYFNNSSPALSPMSVQKRDETQDFKLNNSSDLVLNSYLNLEKEGTFSISEEEALSANNFTFLVQDTRFPRFTQATDLIQPLFYMSSPREIEMMKNSGENKKALDLYLLNVAKGDQNLAKKIVSKYYERVASANNLFSNYKEGWKTDKGMIYIIMGPPSRVQKSKQKEIWQYAQLKANSDIIFTFQKKVNKLNSDHYELVRYPEYTSYWYPYVELWRSGNIVE